MLAKILVSSSIDSRIEESIRILASHLLSGNVEFRKHPDVLVLEAGEKLGIEQARIIKDHLSFKPFQAKGRGVVIEDATLLTPEAQNALLKTLEELPENSILILGVNSEHDFLPTILSRCEIIYIHSVIPSKEGNQLRTSTHNKLDEEIRNLINSNLEAQFEYIEKLKEKKEFLFALTKFFRLKLLSLPLNSSIERNKGNEVKVYLKELLQAEKWVNQNVNPRGILEYLMLVMPKKK